MPTTPSIKTNILRPVHSRGRCYQYTYFRHGQDKKNNWEKLQYIVSLTIYNDCYKINKTKKYADYCEHTYTLKYYSNTSSRVTADNDFLM